MSWASVMKKASIMLEMAVMALLVAAVSAEAELLSIYTFAEPVK